MEPHLRNCSGCSNAAELNFAGVDLFIHKDKGPMVVELMLLQAYQFQAANRAA
jgi:hypothetical protein